MLFEKIPIQVKTVQPDIEQAVVSPPEQVFKGNTLEVIGTPCESVKQTAFPEHGQIADEITLHVPESDLSAVKNINPINPFIGNRQ
jgi:hypothetical protein